jgi:type IV pilus assembly protein PilN
VRISVNLATHPYIELRPVYNRLRTWILIVSLTGLALLFLYHGERDQAQETLARVASVQNHVRDLEREQQGYVTLMQQPKDAAILRQSGYLNSLFRRKAFSWTATMTDLETVLPSGVQVLSIDPIVATDGHVTIRLRVTGARDRALDLIRNLEKSKHFAAPRLASETLANNPGTQANVQNVSTNSNVNFDILADYRPLPLPQKGGKAKAEEGAGTSEKGTPAKRPRMKKPRAARGPLPAANPAPAKGRPHVP